MCRCHEGDPYRMPTMAHLPGTHETGAIAFTGTYLDYLRPLIIKTSEGQMKVYMYGNACDPT